MRENSVKFSFVYRGSECLGFRHIRWENFKENSLFGSKQLIGVEMDSAVRLALNVPLKENVKKREEIEHELKHEKDSAKYINIFCDFYKKDNYSIADVFDYCVIYRENKQLTLILVNDDTKVVSEDLTPWTPKPTYFGIYNYQRLSNIDYTLPKTYSYQSPSKPNDPKLTVHTVKFNESPVSDFFRYNFLADRLEAGIPDGLIISLEINQKPKYPRALKKSFKKINPNFFDLWPEIPHIVQPYIADSDKANSQVPFTTEKLVRKDFLGAIQHIEYCKAFEYPESYYKFGLKLINSRTKAELVFPEIFVKIRVVRD